MKKSIIATLLLLAGSSLALFAGGNSEASASSSKAQPKKVLRVMNTSDFDSLDPQMSVFTASFEVIGNFTDGLKQIAPDGTTVNALTSSETVSPDGLTYTFKLRPDAYWSNGEPVTADDFVFAWRRVVDPDSGSESTFKFTDMAHIKNAAQIVAGELPYTDLGVKALDSKTFQVELDTPVPYFDSLLSACIFYPMNEEFFKSTGDQYGTSPETLLSNGAFIMTDYQPAAKHFVLEKNPNYYDADRIKIDRLEYQEILDSQSALMNFQAGAIDQISLSGEQIEQVEDDPSFSTYRAGNLWSLSVNLTDNKYLANKNFRLALTNAIDRERIVNDVTNDGSYPTYSLVPSGLAFDSEGNDFTPNTTEYADVCSYNPEKASMYYQKALEELGVDSIELNLLVDSTTVSQNIAVVIKDEVESVMPGLTLHIEVEPKKQRIQDYLHSNFDLVLSSWGPDYHDATTFLNLFVTGGTYDVGHWSNAEYDDIIARSISGDLVTKPAERILALKRAERIGMEDVVSIPLYEQSNAVMVNPKVKGIAFHSMALSRVYKDVTIDD